MHPFRPLSSLAMLGTTALLAQGPYVGFKAGLNVSNLHNNEVTSDNSRLGFNGGVFGRSNIDAPFGAQVELLCSAKGNTTHYQGFLGLVDQDVDFNINYIELPVMAAIRLADNALELHAGGYVALLLNANVSSSGDLGNSSDTIDRDNFQPIDAGLVGGLAFNVGPIQIGARYEYGLVKIANSDAAENLLGNAGNSCAQLYIAVGSQ